MAKEWQPITALGRRILAFYLTGPETCLDGPTSFALTFYVLVAFLESTQFRKVATAALVGQQVGSALPQAE
jgi:hypothetical protein